MDIIINNKKRKYKIKNELIIIYVEKYESQQLHLDIIDADNKGVFKSDVYKDIGSDELILTLDSIPFKQLREHKRYSTCVLCHIICEDIHVNGICRNISVNGLLFESPYEFAKDKELQIEIITEYSPINIRASIIYVRNISGCLCAYGCKIISDNQKIEEYMKQLGGGEYQ